MHGNGTMRPDGTILGMGGGETKEKNGDGEFN
jgi:hypothetical protein